MGEAWTRRRRGRRGRRGRALRGTGAGLIAVVALSDVAYRLLMREPLRRALGVQTRHA